MTRSDRIRVLFLTRVNRLWRSVRVLAFRVVAMATSPCRMRAGARPTEDDAACYLCVLNGGWARCKRSRPPAADRSSASH